MVGEEKTKYLKIALGLCGISINDATSELIWRTLKSLNKKGANFSLKDSAKIHAIVMSKTENKKPIIEEKLQEELKSTVTEIKKAGRVNEKVDDSNLLSESSVNSKKYKYHADFKKNKNTLVFKNKQGHEFVFRYDKSDYFIPITLTISEKEVVLTDSQLAKLYYLCKSHGVNYQGVHQEVYDISNNFKHYRDASGKTKRVK